MILFIISITTVSAQIDLKDSLTSWYVQTFKLNTSNHANDVADRFSSVEKDINFTLNQTPKDITKTINDFLNTSTANSKEDIQTQLEQYKKEINKTKEQLLLQLSDEELAGIKQQEIYENMEAIVTDLLREILEK